MWTILSNISLVWTNSEISPSRSPIIRIEGDSFEAAAWNSRLRLTEQSPSGAYRSPGTRIRNCRDTTVAAANAFGARSTGANTYPVRATMHAGRLLAFSRAHTFLRERARGHAATRLSSAHQHVRSTRNWVTCALLRLAEPASQIARCNSTVTVTDYISLGNCCAFTPPWASHATVWCLESRDVWTRLKAKKDTFSPRRSRFHIISAGTSIANVLHRDYINPWPYVCNVPTGNARRYAKSMRNQNYP